MPWGPQFAAPPRDSEARCRGDAERDQHTEPRRGAHRLKAKHPAMRQRVHAADTLGAQCEHEAGCRHDTPGPQEWLPARSRQRGDRQRGQRQRSPSRQEAIFFGASDWRQRHWPPRRFTEEAGKCRCMPSCFVHRPDEALALLRLDVRHQHRRHQGCRHQPADGQRRKQAPERDTAGTRDECDATEAQGHQADHRVVDRTDRGQTEPEAEPGAVLPASAGHHAMQASERQRQEVQRLQLEMQHVREAIRTEPPHEAADDRTKAVIEHLPQVPPHRPCTCRQRRDEDDVVAEDGIAPDRVDRRHQQ